MTIVMITDHGHDADTANSLLLRGRGRGFRGFVEARLYPDTSQNQPQPMKVFARHSMLIEEDRDNTLTVALNNKEEKRSSPQPESGHRY